MTDEPLDVRDPKTWPKEDLTGRVPLDLEPIEARDFEEQPALFDGHHGPGAIQDRRALLAEVKRLRAQLEALRRYRAAVEGFEYPIQPEDTP